ncbi:MAG: hypothetical protein ACQEQC_07310 [Elusimicrobiota bacterium]
MKKDILKKIDEAIITEEKAVPIYAKHLESTLFWSDMPEEYRERIKKLFEKLKEESLGHKGKLEYIKKKIQEGGK